MFADSDHDALIKKWPSIEKKPFEMFQVNLDRSSNKYHRDPILHNMLTFVKLFPTHRYKFERAVDSLIVFSDVSYCHLAHSSVFKFRFFVFIGH